MLWMSSMMVHGHANIYLIVAIRGYIELLSIEWKFFVVTENVENEEENDDLSVFLNDTSKKKISLKELRHLIFLVIFFIFLILIPSHFFKKYCRVLKKGRLFTSHYTQVITTTSPN